VPDAGILTENILSEEVGSAVDKDFLLRPGIHDVPAPGELSVEVPMKTLVPRLRDGRSGKN
jgi:hypothetical protein